MKDCLGKFRTEANRKFRSIAREAYGLGSCNDAKRANKLLDNYSFTYQPAEKVSPFRTRYHVPAGVLSMSPMLPSHYIPGFFHIYCEVLLRSALKFYFLLQFNPITFHHKTCIFPPADLSFPFQHLNNTTPLTIIAWKKTILP